MFIRERFEFSNRIFCTGGADVVCNVRRELENVVLTLLVYIDCTDCTGDEETTISSLFSSSSLTSTSVNGIDYVYVKSNVSSIFTILSTISYRIYLISKSIES